MPVGPPLSEDLRAALGSPAVVRRLPSSPRSRVWLAEFDGSPAIIKRITGGADADARFAREVTALRLARRVRPFVVPGVLGTDPGGRVMVLEYLSELGRTPAPDWMTEYATALARLHAATGPDDAGALPAWTGPSQADARAFTRLAERLGVGVPAGLTATLDDLAERLNAAGHHALLHGDPCPGNAMRTTSGIMFVDLEQAALGDGRAELAYPRIGFPTCWCATSVPGPALRQAEAAYRATWRARTGTEAGGDLTEACAGWLIRGDALVQRAHRGRADQLARLPDEDWRWGTATARQRLLHRLAVVAALGADHPRLASLASLSSAIRERILALWPGLEELPVADDDPLRAPPPLRAGAGLGLVVLGEEGAELVDGFVLVRAQVLDQGHLSAGPVGAGVVPAVGRRDQQMVVRDLDVVVHLLPRDAGRHQADRGRAGVVKLKVLEHAPPSGGLLSPCWGTRQARSG